MTEMDQIMHVLVYAMEVNDVVAMEVNDAIPWVL